MVSYIIIGRNEGWKLELCLKSVYESIAENSYIESEVIYIDSNSTDNSIEIAQKFKPLSIFQLTGECNAAIARNLGAEKANGDILYFIDGDMEIDKHFLKHVINRNGKLSYYFVGGYYIGKYYSDDWELLYAKQIPSKNKLKIEYFEAFTGGLFIISKAIWLKVGGMKPYMTGGEDPELAIRLAQMGIFKLWKNAPMAIHHTKVHENRQSIGYLFKKRNLRARILTYRENLLSKYALKKLFRQEYMALLLVAALFLLLVNYKLFLGALGIYFIGQIVKSFKRTRHLKLFPSLIIRDLVFLIGFFIYWPKRKIEIKYQSIS